MYNSFYTRSNRADKGFLKLTTGQKKRGNVVEVLLVITGEARSTNQSFLKKDEKDQKTKAADIKKTEGVIPFPPFFNTVLN